MPGSKIPVLEIEKLKLTRDGRGIEVYNDGNNLIKSRVWLGLHGSGSKSSGCSASPRFLIAASSSGWLKIHMISGSTYGVTGATYFIPVFNDVNTKSST